MEAIEKKDILNLAVDPFVRSILAQNGTLHSLLTFIEEIYLSSLIIKYNRYGFKQERKIIVTNLHLFNISKQSKQYIRSSYRDQQKDRLAEGGCSDP
jgi:hypothetical protein